MPFLNTAEKSDRHLKIIHNSSHLKVGTIIVQFSAFLTGLQVLINKFTNIPYLFVNNRKYLFFYAHFHAISNRGHIPASHMTEKREGWEIWVSLLVLLPW